MTTPKGVPPRATVGRRWATLGLFLATSLTPGAWAQDRVTIADGTLQGTASAGVYSFKGIPFAAPPVGDLRWRPPQPVQPWAGARPADNFGPRAMQRPLFGDMVFRGAGMSEDCLYLNVWTPAPRSPAKLPVLVYFYGGGFVAGDGSEPRYDGASMAHQGLVAVTVNYRLGVFGFLAHPALAQESPQRAAGNYGLLDQVAALQWVRRNIAAFGGDPQRVTIAGESAGSISVSALMASPLAKGLIAGAMGESGSILGALPAAPLAQAERSGVRFAAGLGLGERPSLAALRALPAEQLLAATAKPGLPWFRPTVDGYFFPKPPPEIYAAGEQAHVPLLVGSNSEEMGPFAVLGQAAPSLDGYRKALERLYPGRSDLVFSLYPAANAEEVTAAARDLASDRFISYSTWKWLDLATKTGGQPTYYYLYSHPRPGAHGAVHSAEIEYALGNLDGNKVYAWTPDDYRVSRLMQAYFANFIKTGAPNGPGLPRWPEFARGQRQLIDVQTHAAPERVRARYEFLDRFSQND